MLFAPRKATITLHSAFCTNFEFNLPERNQNEDLIHAFKNRNNRVISAFGIGKPRPGVGAAAGVGVGLIFNTALEHTSIVYDYKEAAGLVTDQAISLFDRLFN